MYYSKNNITAPFPNSKISEYAILNPLSGSFDILSEAEYRLLNLLKNNGATDPSKPEFYQYLLERGYLFTDKEAEAAIIRQKYAEFQAEIDNSPVQLLLIPSYGCNLACSYCYEHSLPEKGKLITKETVDAFFSYIGNNFKHKRTKPFITLFGGEPLIDSPVHREIISYIIDRCASEDYEMAAVSNGYDLASYIAILANAKIKEIQVTLDGSKDVHDKRRGTKKGAPTFAKIINGLEAAVVHHFPINLRTVVDFENLTDLVKLAEFLDQKGWLDLGPELFKTQIGRNYELFDCYAKPEHLMSQVELWTEFVKLSRDYPILKKFHRPDFKGIRHLVDTGAMYLASFDTCPAAKTEWVFDLYGDIYGCTASCGRSEFKLGTYYPEITHDQGRISLWQMRNVLTIPECVDCGSNIICGGGCGVIAAHKTGKILSPDCRPIQELMELGINYYHAEIEAMAGSNPVYTSGCLVCGAELIYNSQTSPVKCEFCKRNAESIVTCSNDHYVCEDCHRRDILDLVEQVCLHTTLTDPVALALNIFELPGLHMHGPEYHSIVPAIIVAANGNNINNKNPEDIKTAIERGKAIQGGVCGTHGACGAAIGLGIAVAIINKVTPLSKETRGLANKMTAAALSAISEYDGPRCCKRETITTLEIARKFILGLNNEIGAVYQCSQFPENKDCLKNDCPYYKRVNTIKQTVT